MKKASIHIPLAALAALLILLMALLTGGTLAVLWRMHNRTAHETAALSVVEKGRIIAENLARQPVVERGEAGGQSWSDFSRLIHAMNAAEDSLQFVSVTHGGVTVFQEHTIALDGQKTAPGSAPAPVRIGRRVLNVGQQELPVVSFLIEAAGADGLSSLVEVGLRKEAVDREERAAAQAVRSMFALSLAVVVVSFSICWALVVWLLRREGRRESARRAEEHLAFSGVLANGIVHDFRNPMSSLRLDAQMLQKEAARGAECKLERVGQLADRIRNTLDRMEKVFQEFLFLSKPASEARERMNVAGFVRDAVEMLHSRFEHAGVRVRLEIPEPSPEVTGNAPALRRALINVLINAEQHSPRGGEIVVRAAVEKNEVWLEVADQGPGLAREARKNLFKMFNTTRPQGTGLGLFLARTAMENNGGRIVSLDPPGGGACFRLVFAPAPLEGEHEQKQDSGD